MLNVFIEVFEKSVPTAKNESSQQSHPSPSNQGTIENVYRGTQDEQQTSSFLAPSFGVIFILENIFVP